MNTQAFRQWVRSLPKEVSLEGLPPRGLVAAALCVLERLREKPSVNFRDHLTPKSGQIAGVTRAKQDAILARFGERRLYTKEGGRTNRGNHVHVEQMLKSIGSDGFVELSAEDQWAAIDDMQGILIEIVRKHFELAKLTFDIPQPLSAHGCVSAILEAASKVAKAGPVAQHLVAAKLRVRFPGTDIATFPVFAQDSQAGRKGDVVVNDMVFHVTIAPNDSHYLACSRNVAEGMLATLLVPSRLAGSTKQFLENTVESCGITVLGIEEFVAQNIGELSAFKSKDLAAKMGQLLREYNRIVDEHESDKSFMIDIADVFD